MHMDPEENEIDVSLPKGYFWVNKIPIVGWRRSSTGIPLPAYYGTTNFLDLPRFQLLAETWDSLLPSFKDGKAIPINKNLRTIIKYRIEFLDFQKFRGVLDAQGD